MVLHEAEQGQLLFWFDSRIGIAVETKHTRRADVVRRRRNVQNEAAREKVFAMLWRLGVRIDENVCKRRCGVADVGALLEGVKQLADAAVDGGYIIIIAFLPLRSFVLMEALSASSSITSSGTPRMILTFCPGISSPRT